MLRLIVKNQFSLIKQLTKIHKIKIKSKITLLYFLHLD